MGVRVAALALLVALCVADQWPMHCGNPQHTAQSATPSQCMTEVRWSFAVDTSNDVTDAHYGSPLITAAGTVIVAQRTDPAGLFRILALDGAARGAIIWEEASDYLYPYHGWAPMIQPVLAGAPGSSQRVYWPVAGGAVRFRDNIDQPVALTSGLVFPWGTPDTYAAMANDLRNSVMINSPLVSRGGDDGAVYYAVRLQGPTPASVVAVGLTTSTLVRVGADGAIVTTTADAVGGSAAYTRFAMQAAPAFSNALDTMYVVVMTLSYNGDVQLAGLDPATLAVRVTAGGDPYRVVALDPRSTSASCHVFEDSSSSIMVGPDGDVYYGALGNPNRFTGWLLHWDATLRTAKLPGPFGWDNTPSVVPRALVLSYDGPSPYLIATKYNSYVGLEGGRGMHRLVVLDPQVSEMDILTGMAVMRVVMSQLAPTLDGAVQTSYPDARKEWCTNTAVVSLADHSVVANNEDGHSYRWDLYTNNLTQVLRMSAGRRQAYTPTAISPSGEVLAINWAVLNVMGRSYSDVNRDDVVDLLDVVAVLDNMGACANVRDCPADVDGNGTVDAADIHVIASKWGLRCGQNG